jgi:hypothetical protein
MPASGPLIPFGDYDLNPETGLYIDYVRPIDALARGTSDPVNVHLHVPGEKEPKMMKFANATAALTARSQLSGVPLPTTADPAAGAAAGAGAPANTAATVGDAAPGK